MFIYLSKHQPIENTQFEASERGADLCPSFYEMYWQAGIFLISFFSGSVKLNCKIGSLKDLWICIQHHGLTRGVSGLENISYNCRTRHRSGITPGLRTQPHFICNTSARCPFSHLRYSVSSDKLPTPQFLQWK